MSVLPPPEPATLRSDAQRNRRALLAAAAAAFAEGGIDVPAEEIARRAGVAKGTLFRHFPAKRDLLAAVVLDRLRMLTDAIEQVSRERAAGLEALAEVMTAGAAMLAADRSFFDAAMREAAALEPVAAAKLELATALERLVLAAQRSGDVRGDVTGIDIAMLMMAATNTTAPALAQEPQLWRRYLALMIDGLRAGATTPLPVRPLAPAQMAAALACSPRRA